LAADGKIGVRFVSRRVQAPLSRRCGPFGAP
jgi:hypothetical protein